MRTVESGEADDQGTTQAALLPFSLFPPSRISIVSLSSWKMSPRSLFARQRKRKETLDLLVCERRRALLLGRFGADEGNKAAPWPPYLMRLFSRVRKVCVLAAHTQPLRSGVVQHAQGSLSRAARGVSLGGACTPTCRISTPRGGITCEMAVR